MLKIVGGSRGRVNRDILRENFLHHVLKKDPLNKKRISLAKERGGISK